MPPALAISPEKAIEKHDACAAAISSSGLVAPSASSEVRLGHETSKVPSPELVSSVRPEPSCRVPVQAVRAVRVGMTPLPVGRRPLMGGVGGPTLPGGGATASADRLAAVHALGEQARAGT